MSHILLLGANGAIGSILARELVAHGHNVASVTRNGAGDSRAFAEVMQGAPGVFDLVIDASSGSLNDYLDLRDWLNRSEIREFIHFSTVRIRYGDEKDGYALSKQSVLRILGEVSGSCSVIEGDLFADNKTLVGYWGFVTDYTRWRFFSHRDLYVAPLSGVAQTLHRLAAGERSATSHCLNGLPVLDIPLQRVQARKLSTAAAKLLFRFRANVFLKRVKTCLVL